jgi:FKBP12-rapamycin complex-associated protein
MRAQFIHDPLLTWRLGHRESPHEPNFPSERRQSIIGSEIDTTHNLASLSRPRHRSSVATNNPANGLGAPANEAEAKEVQNARAVVVLGRVKEKLTGRDFGAGAGQELGIVAQVDRLIKEATNLENLCQHYIGWCSFW